MVEFYAECLRALYVTPTMFPLEEENQKAHTFGGILREGPFKLTGSLGSRAWAGEHEISALRRECQTMDLHSKGVPRDPKIGTMPVQTLEASDTQGSRGWGYHFRNLVGCLHGDPDQISSTVGAGFGTPRCYFPKCLYVSCYLFGEP